MGCHVMRPSRRGVFAAPVALLLSVWWGPPALAASGGPAVAKVLTTCSFSALKSAVAAGGSVDYGTNCQSPPVSFASTISVPSGLTVNIEANGHSVTFDGGAKVRLFEVTGGKLTIGGITLSNAEVSTANGKAGSTGGTGKTGPAGATGANGANGSPGANGGPGHAGGGGGKPTAGQPGGAGQSAKLASGAALLITAGTVALNDDTLLNDIAAGGSGGLGGDGGVGGNGGGGGNGGTGGGGGGGNPGQPGGSGGAGGVGGNGSAGAAGGAGGSGGAGGAAQGGAVWNAGMLTVAGSSFSEDEVIAGPAAAAARPAAAGTLAGVAAAAPADLGETAAAGPPHRPEPGPRAARTGWAAQAGQEAQAEQAARAAQRRAERSTTPGRCRSPAAPWPMTRRSREAQAPAAWVAAAARQVIPASSVKAAAAQRAVLAAPPGRAAVPRPAPAGRQAPRGQCMAAPSRPGERAALRAAERWAAPPRVARCSIRAP